ncbi:Fc.00g057560.m01.CDS01 [Cosmosporella sp. VM-42]
MENTKWIASASRSDLLEVGEFCPRQPYIEVQIPATARRVTRVEITTTSHDQGFSNDQARLGGTYEASNTWFEIAVITPTYHERIPSKIFQKNVHASIQPRRHQNVWDVEANDPVKNELLASIQAGDTVQIVPRADFMLWANYVHSVECSIEGESIPQNAGLPSDILPSPVDAIQAELLRPLDPTKRQTRIITLHPGAFDAPLCFSKRTINLEEADHPKYEALSYCWGDVARRKAVRFLDAETDSFENEEASHEIFINSALDDALRHLRPESGMPRTMWIDALCINQDDLEERAQQVALMPHIYRQADGVVIWLGTSNPIRKECFSTVKGIQSRLESRAPDPQTSEAELFRDVFNAVFTVHDIPPFTGKWRECNFDWFKRTWVLQEVANARTAVVHCGFDTASWSILSALANEIAKHKTHSPLLRYGVMSTMFSSFFHSLNGRSHWLDHGELQEILDVFIRAHSLKASDPRDKLFALLQFGKETEDIANLPPLIKPNYFKPVERVFPDFVRWWISTHKSLRVLSAVHAQPGRSWQKMYAGETLDLSKLGYPSWCLFPAGEGNWAKATLGLTTASPYAAAGSSTPDIDLVTSLDAIENFTELHLTGHRICNVALITSFQYWAKDGLTQPKSLHQAFHRIFNPTSHRRAWLLDRDDQQEMELEAETQKDYYARHVTYHRRGFNAHSNSFSCLSDSLFYGDSMEKELIGLCPHNAAPGDIVVMLYGGPVLYLLREASPKDGESGEENRGKRYYLVGECILHGYMNGEMVRNAQEQGLETERFIVV